MSVERYRGVVGLLGGACKIISQDKEAKRCIRSDPICMHSKDLVDLRWERVESYNHASLSLKPYQVLRPDP